MLLPSAGFDCEELFPSACLTCEELLPSPDLTCSELLPSEDLTCEEVLFLLSVLVVVLPSPLLEEFAFPAALLSPAC